MYRNLFTVLLCISTVVAAPQNSNITYVKRQAVPEEPQPELKQTKTFRESNIEKLPLTIPGTYNSDIQKETIKNPIKDENIEKKEPTNDTRIYNYSDRIYSIKTKPKKNNKNNVTDKIVAIVKEVKGTDIISTDILPLESEKAETLAIKENSTLKFETISENSTLKLKTNSENSTLKLETTTTDTNEESVTESFETDPTINTEVEEITTIKALAVSLPPKLGHYGKSSSKSFSQNLIGYSGKRRFRSRCRCEKIWNCAKLQISVPRCPEEYFLCCG